MPLREFRLTFDRPHATYAPGETVNGTVVLVIDSPKKIRGVNFFVTGAADTYWTADRSELNNEGRYENEHQLVTGHEQYFSMNYYLVGAANGPELHLPPGSHSWNFTFTLPPILPSSFESDYGRIRYTVKAVLDRPWKFDQASKCAFTVISPLKLDNLQDASGPVQVEESKTFCCLCCGSAPLTVHVNLPVRGYVPGQQIPIALNIENHSGKDITRMEIKLMKFITFRATQPRSEVKEETRVVAEISKGPFGGTETVAYDQILDVPSIPPSSLHNCGIIDIEYKLGFEAKMEGWYNRNLCFDKLIYIGTIPLSNYRTPSTMPLPKMNYIDSNNDVSSKMNEGAPLYPPPSAPPQPMDYPTTPPPSYEESIYRSRGLWDRGESSEIIGASNSFAPRYPVYNFAPFQQ